MAAEILCAAVTCLHNAGNLGGRAPKQGEFPCAATSVRFGCVDVEGECPECARRLELEQRMDCRCYTRHLCALL